MKQHNFETLGVFWLNSRETVKVDEKSYLNCINKIIILDIITDKDR